MSETIVPPVSDVILRDGSTLRLSAPTVGDIAELLDLVEGLSQQSRFMRFHGYAAAGEAFARPLVDPDWVERGALVGKIEHEGVEQIVALGNYVRLRELRTAEVAFIVADAFQRRGVGTRLLEQLARRAGAAGIERFTAFVLPDNRAMLEVLEHIGFQVVRTLEGGVVEAGFSIASTELYQDSVDERDRVGVVASLRPFFEPRSVAVVGASSREGSIGGAVFRNIVRGDFAGAAYPVNRDGSPVGGVRAYSSLGELPEPPDLAVIALPGEAVLGAAAEAFDAGTRAVCVISAGFAEIGPEGAARQEALLALVRAHGARLIGPNCLGLASAQVRLNATFAPRGFPPGTIGFSSQSGALGLALLERAAEHQLGFSAFVSIGNKADISSNDLLEWWESDPGTQLVLLYLESFGNPRKFARIAQRVSRSKPVLAIKSGRSAAGQRAAGSHTAALAGSDAAADALFRQAGVIRADSLEELLDTASLLSSQPLPAGRRVAVITNAGGLGILCADACAHAGLELPPPAPAACEALRAGLPAAASVGNPVDMLGGAGAADFRRCAEILLDDDATDALIVLFVPTAGVSAYDVGLAIAEAVTARQGRKPVLACLLSQERAAAGSGLGDHAIPTFAYPEAAAAALGRAVERSVWLRRGAGVVRRPEGIELAVARELVAATGEGRWLEAAEARRLLEAYGIPLVPERIAETPAAAVAAAEGLGYPVVVKTAAAGAHKTETGGVALDLETAAAVEEAATRIGGPVVVQQMAVGGSAEFLAGVVQDPVFGPLVAFGPGGVLAELIGDAHVRLAPLSDVDVEELLDDGKAGRLVRGFRSAPPVDRRALGDLLLRLSVLADDLPEVEQLDLNPVIGFADRVVVVDARVRVSTPAGGAGLKTW